MILINPHQNNYLFVNKEYITSLVIKCNRGNLAEALYTSNKDIVKHGIN